MEKKRTNIWGIFYAILTVLLICNTIYTQYPWMKGELPVELSDFQFYEGRFVASITFLLILLWFSLYCMHIYKLESKTKLPYEKEKRRWVIVLPLYLLGMNIILHIAFVSFLISDIWYDDEILTKIVCLMMLFVIIGFLFYMGKQDNIIIWYPFSLYCTLYPTPFEIRVTGLDFIVISGIIEYGIMLYLNRKKWYIPKDKRQKNE